MEKRPILSVIIPVYNGEKFIQRSILSVLKQPCAQHIELIVVNDGSTDNTLSICEELSKLYRNLKVISKQNEGVAIARNTGIWSSTGKYVAFLDCDDWWVENFFTLDVLDLLDEDYDLYRFAFYQVSPSRKFRKLHTVNRKESRELHPDPSREYSYAHCSYIYNRSLLIENKIFYPNFKAHEDWPFVHLAVTMASSIRQVDRVFLCYWMNSKSCLHTITAQEKMAENVSSLQAEETLFQKRGFSISTDRERLSTIVDLLPELCSELSFRETLHFLQGDLYSLLCQNEIKPWASLQKRQRIFQRAPFLFWVKSKIHPGVYKAIKQALNACKFTQPIAELLQYKFLYRWSQ